MTHYLPVNNPFTTQHVVKRLSQCDSVPLVATVTDGQTSPERAIVGRVGEILRCDPRNGDIVLQLGPGPLDRTVVRGGNYAVVDSI